MNVPTIKIEQPVVMPPAQPAIPPAVAPATINTGTIAANTNGAYVISSPNKPRRHPSFYVPANWNSEPEGDIFVFTNNTTGDEFKGTPKEFSRMLREE